MSRPLPAGAEPTRPGPLARASTTQALTLVLAVVSLAMIALGVTLVVRGGAADGSTEVADNTLNVPADRPVIAAEAAVLEGVAAAARSAQEIVAVDHASYDAEVDAAAELMTAGFEQQYRRTTAAVKSDFVAQETVVQANVVAQGVVSADRTRLQALVFLNQVVTRAGEGEPETVATPYKVLVTMVHTDQGWLVDRLDTDEPKQDTDN